MKIKIAVQLVCFCLLPSDLCLPALGQGTAFNYQGRLNDGGGPANGTYDLKFTIYDSTNNPGVVIAGPITNSPTGVTNGFFTVLLDFGAAPFTNGASRWLEIGVRTNGGGSFATLSPRQQLTPVPYAIYAEAANAAGLSGTIPSPSLGGTYGNAVNFNNGANSFDGTFTGMFFGSVFTGGIFTGSFLGSGVGLGDVWHTVGNFGTTPAANFLGTLDNQPLEVRVNNQRAFRWEPANDINVGFAPNVIGGHQDNSILTNIGGSVISGGGGVGLSNTIASTEGVIAGGYLNHIEGGNAHASTIGGGFDNTIRSSAARSVIAGGHANRIGTNSFESAIGGGTANVLGTNAVQATIAGGDANMILDNASWSVIGGGAANQAASINGFIGGGWDNIIPTNANYASIVGGIFNTNTSFAGFIGGGYLNSANGNYSTIGGGQGNNVSGGWYSTIGGGALNVNGGYAATIAGGILNTNTSNVNYGAIGGGLYNTVSAVFYGTIPGGYSNLAAGNYTFAAGRQARALHDGSFVWADSTAADFPSTGNDQFLVRANGGLLFANGPAGVTVDQFGLNNGEINYGLKFGPASGEGIASKRTGGGNQFGLDFYTQFNPRVSISQTGTVSIPGLLRSGVETNTSEAPNPPGLIVRRINSTSVTIGQVVARTEYLTLERDGSNGGFIIRYVATPGFTTIAAMGMNSAGTQVNFYTTLNNPGVAGTLVLYADGQNIVHFECTFGRTFDFGQNLTRVTLTRYTADNFWSGDLVSTFNQ